MKYKQFLTYYIAEGEKKHDSEKYILNDLTAEGRVRDIQRICLHLLI